MILSEELNSRSGQAVLLVDSQQDCIASLESGGGCCLFPSLPKNLVTSCCPTIELFRVSASPLKLLYFLIKLLYK